MRNDAGDLRLSAASNSPFIYLKSSNGNVGIGTTNPTTARLVISGTAGATGLDMATNDQYAEMRVIRNSLSTLDKDLYLNFSAGANSKTRIYSNNVETMLVSGGNVGIGTNNPVARLHILEATGTIHGANTGSIIIDHENSGGASSITFRSKVNRGSDYAYIQYQDAPTIGAAGESGRLIIGIQNEVDDHIQLMPSGNVGVNVATPAYKML